MWPTRQGHSVLFTQFSPSHHLFLTHLQACISRGSVVTPGQSLQGDGAIVVNSSRIVAVTNLIRRNQNLCGETYDTVQNNHAFRLSIEYCRATSLESI
jgi:hypothetical protein